MKILMIAAQEIRVGLRNRWVAATTGLMAALALSLVLLGSAPTGAVGADPLAIVVVSLTSLTIFLIPLIALLLSFDGIVGEHERGTLMLLLSYPVARWQVVVGKVLGQTAILGVATLVGYGAAAAALSLRRPTSRLPPGLPIRACWQARSCSAPPSSPWAAWPARWCASAPRREAWRSAPGCSSSSSTIRRFSGCWWPTRAARSASTGSTRCCCSIRPTPSGCST
jgi:hypothetical protein